MILMHFHFIQLIVHHFISATYSERLVLLPYSGLSAIVKSKSIKELPEFFLHNKLWMHSRHWRTQRLSSMRLPLLLLHCRKDLNLSVSYTMVERVKGKVKRKYEEVLFSKAKDQTGEQMAFESLRGINSYQFSIENHQAKSWEWRGKVLILFSSGPQGTRPELQWEGHTSHILAALLTEVTAKAWQMTAVIWLLAEAKCCDWIQSVLLISCSSNQQCAGYAMVP